MRSTIIHGPGDVRLETVADPAIAAPTDAIVRVIRTCVCGSDLWAYRGTEPTDQPHPIGHEFIGVVEETGTEVQGVGVGDFVIAPFANSDGTCANCTNGIYTSCTRGGFWGGLNRAGEQLGGAQAEFVRVPYADGTLVGLPEQPEPDTYASLLTLTDVMGTGHHAAVMANVSPGSTVVVVGDGAVGLCAVIAAKRLGAERIIAMSRHETRQSLAREFGATDVVAERGKEGVAHVKDLIGGGADCALECVGMKDSMSQALASLRPGGHLGFVGVPAGAPELPAGAIFSKNLRIGGGVAPVRGYITELLTDVTTGGINPGKVFDSTMKLDEVGEAYRAMDTRSAIKVMLQV
ncbi:zinc-dependent alcohol dehydrogenase family protein [Hoyosella subflava]|uniref:Theronine dehydrogenase-like Zn-dependent dehydrogenase n=1 Tax=Hoyosella subflava (strain DSM 45089 / JCM 17490 / NBRC 109087 / DQS3-9A1) TaxID=443218 RepID=F6EQ72_HOYSD|nr:zinc-dependent alcohol dehydrogenase family protein [Hoyosella subflava]AEF39495.1 Theronine dehydrogenase-like Zn-dependent dehydrogenase [Hoyosella subflava DQS3-9A1]